MQIAALAWKNWEIRSDYYSAIFKVSLMVIIPVISPLRLTSTHFANLTSGISALAGVDISTIGGGGSIICKMGTW